MEQGGRNSESTSLLQKWPGFNSGVDAICESSVLVFSAPRVFIIVNVVEISMLLIIVAFILVIDNILIVTLNIILIVVVVVIKLLLLLSSSVASSLSL